MATGVSGYFDLTGTSAGITMRIHYEESYNISTNESDVTITSIQVKSSKWMVVYYLDGTIKIGDSVALSTSLSSGANPVSVNTLNQFYEVQGNLGAVSGIAHNANGSKSVTITVNLKGYTQSGNAGNGWAVNGSKTIALTTIPRASSFSVEDGTLGTALNLAVEKADSSFTHTITYECGNASGTVCDKASGTDVSWGSSNGNTLALAAQNTSGQSVSVTFQLQTYSGETAIGSVVSKTVKMAIPESVKPSCALTVSDYMGYAAQYGNYVKSLSRLQLEVATTKAYGADIVSYHIEANGNIYTDANAITDALKEAGVATIKAKVTDTRGRTSEIESASITVIDYTAPSISGLTAVRCNADGTKNAKGQYVKVTFSASVTPLNGLNSAEYILNYKKASAVDWNGIALDELYNDFSVTNYTYIASGGHTFQADAASSYDVEITLTDNHRGIVRSTQAPTAFALMHPNPDGTGIAFGKLCEKSDAFELGMPAYDRFGALIGNGLAAYTGGGDAGIDPNTTLEELCLTSHSHAPQGLGTFYYIHTAFYNTKSATAARMQVAIPYNKTGSIYHRHYSSGAWSSWARYMNADEIYPIGSVCIRFDTTSPATLYGGTWQRIEGRMLFGCASSGTVGATGTHTTGSGSSSLPYVNVAIWRRTA